MCKYLIPLVTTAVLSCSSVVSAESKPELSNQHFSSNKFYVGLGSFTGSGDEEYSFNSSKTYSMDTTSQPIKFGLILNGGRLEFSYNEIDAEYDDGYSDETFSGFDVNYLFMFSPTEKLSSYILLGVGLYNYDDFEVLDEDDDEEDLSGVAYNVGVGVTYSLHKNIELEAGYSYKYISWQEIDISGFSGELEISEDITGFYLGFNIGF